MNRKTLLKTAILSLYLVISTHAIAQTPNKDEVYKNSFRQDIPRSMQDIPYEDEDYLGKMYSPFALVSLPTAARYEKDKLDSGYYLVTPFTENSVDYLIFKRKSVAVAVVPVIDKEELPKKVKKMQISLVEAGHGKYYIVTIKYGLKSYSARLEVSQ